ncbi:MAG: MFS transporter [Candidatus Eisenbacteria bacterium]
MSEPAVPPPVPGATEPAPRTIAGFHPNVIALGLTSLFTDISSEMIVPVLPLFITATLGASVASLGLIEGVAECASSLLRLVSGRVSDRLGHRKPFIVAGYSLSGVCKSSMALAGTWPAMLGLRFGDRVGKALRTPARDALLADSAGAGAMGRAFGMHRAMDTLGAAIGPLVAWWLLRHWSALGAEGYRRIFLVSAIPAAIAVLVLWFMVRAPRAAARTVAEQVASREPLGPAFTRFVTADVLFQLGNSSWAFLLLRAEHSGWSASGVALLYLAYNLCAAVLSFPFGWLSDRVGRRPLLLAGYLLYALAYGIAAFAPTRGGAAAAFLVLAAHTSLMDGQAKSLIADLVPRVRRATAYGAYNAAVGIALLPASVIAGALWQRVGPQAPFAFGAALGVAAAVAFALLMPAHREQEDRHA